MTLPDDDEVQDRADRLGRSWYQQFDGSAQVAHPPMPVLTFLARIVDPASLLDVFWGPGELSDRETASGRAVLVTAQLILDVTYEGVPTEYYPGNPPDGTVQAYAVRRSSVSSIRWKAPRLARPRGSLEAHEIVVSAPDVDWTVELPTARVHRGAEGYFGRVLAAFGLEP